MTIPEEPPDKPKPVQRFFAALLMVVGVLSTLLGGSCVLIGIRSREPTDYGFGLISVVLGAPILVVGLSLIAVGVWLWGKRR